MAIRNRCKDPSRASTSMRQGVCLGGNGMRSRMRRSATPLINLYEEPDHWVYTFEVPGVEPEKLDLKMISNQLTLCGSKSTFYEGESSKVYHREGCVGECEFERTVSVPENADMESVQAILKNGILVVTFEKRGEMHEKSVPISIMQDK